MSIVPDAMAFSTVFVATSLICIAECHELLRRVIKLTSAKPILFEGHAKISRSV
jgi:hypothetical protein